MRSPSILALLLTACPSSPAFEGADSATTDVASDVTETVATETILATEVLADVEPDVVEDAEDVEVSTDVAPPEPPCEGPAGCTVLITTTPSPALAALIDHEGRARVALFVDNGDDTYDLALHTYRGADGWDPKHVGADLAFVSDMAIAQDDQGGVHVLVEALSDQPSATIWYRPTATAWEPDVLVAAERCERPVLTRGRDGKLYGGCVDLDAITLHILRLDGETTATRWTPVVSRPGVGWNDNGIVRVLQLDWTLDAQSQAHVAYRCCESEAPSLFHVAHNVTTWGEVDDLGPTSVGTGVSYLHTKIVIDGRGHTHVIYQTFDEERGRAQLYDYYFDGSNWQRLNIDEADVGGVLAYGLEVMLDSLGNPRVVYRDGDRLSYREWSQSGWSERVPSTYEVDATLSLALVIDGDDGSHVVYTTADGRNWWWTPATPAP